VSPPSKIVSKIPEVPCPPLFIRMILFLACPVDLNPPTLPPCAAKGPFDVPQVTISTLLLRYSFLAWIPHPRNRPFFSCLLCPNTGFLFLLKEAWLWFSPGRVALFLSPPCPPRFSLPFLLTVERWPLRFRTEPSANPTLFFLSHRILNVLSRFSLDFAPPTSMFFFDCKARLPPCFMVERYPPFFLAQQSFRVCFPCFFCPHLPLSLENGSFSPPPPCPLFFSFGNGLFLRRARPSSIVLLGTTHKQVPFFDFPGAFLFFRP